MLVIIKVVLGLAILFGSGRKVAGELSKSSSVLLVGQIKGFMTWIYHNPQDDVWLVQELNLGTPLNTSRCLNMSSPVVPLRDKWPKLEAELVAKDRPKSIVGHTIWADESALIVVCLRASDDCFGYDIETANITKWTSPETNDTSTKSRIFLSDEGDKPKKSYGVDSSGQSLKWTSWNFQNDKLVPNPERAYYLCFSDKDHVYFANNTDCRTIILAVEFGFYANNIVHLFTSDQVYIFDRHATGGNPSILVVRNREEYFHCGQVVKFRWVWVVILIPSLLLVVVIVLLILLIVIKVDARRKLSGMEKSLATLPQTASHYTATSKDKMLNKSLPTLPTKSVENASQVKHGEMIAPTKSAGLAQAAKSTKSNLGVASSKVKSTRMSPAVKVPSTKNLSSPSSSSKSKQNSTSKEPSREKSKSSSKSAK